MKKGYAYPIENFKSSRVFNHKKYYWAGIYATKDVVENKKKSYENIEHSARIVRVNTQRGKMYGLYTRKSKEKRGAL